MSTIDLFFGALFLDVKMLNFILILILLVMAFIAGAFVAVVGSDSMGRKYVNEVLIKILLIAVTIMEDIEYIKSTKYHMMGECGYDENEIKAQKNIDDHDFRKWKAMVIRSIVTRHPYPKDLEFNSWDGAILYLTNYFEDLADLSKQKNKTNSVNKKI